MMIKSTALIFSVPGISTDVLREYGDVVCQSVLCDSGHIVQQSVLYEFSSV